MDKKLTPREIKRIESDKKIIKAAIEIIGKKGYSNANLREIATAAGITQGLISQRFETKENLLLQAIKQSNSIWLHEEFTEEMPLEEVLTIILDDTKVLYDKNIDVYNFFCAICGASDVPEEITNRQIEFFRNSTVCKVMKRAQALCYIPEGDLADLFNIFICDAFRLIRDYKRLGIKLPEDKYFMAAIQYKNPIVEEQEYLRSKAFETISEPFFTLVYFYIQDDQYRIAKSRPEYEKYFSAENAQDMLNRGCQKMVAPEYQKDIFEFLNLSTVIERLDGKKVIASIFKGIDGCEYRVSFIFVEHKRQNDVVLCGINKMFQ